MEKYDEDITENLFFRELSHHFEHFHEKAATRNWMVCVPQTGGFPKYGFSQEDFENHILISKKENESSYKTLSGKEITICDKSITTGKGFSDIRNINILFEETFYIKNGKNFRILCIEKMLEGFTDDLPLIEKIVELNSLRDCINLLWREIDHKIQHLIDEHIDEWNLKNQSLEFETIQSMRDLTSALYTKILQLVLKDASLKKKVWINKFLLESIQLAVETYTMHGVYKRVMSGVTAYFSREDAQLNKIIRNLSDIQGRDLNIKPEFISVLPRARQELSRIDWYTTPLDKIACIQKMIFALIQFKKTKSLLKQAKATLSTDDLLPIIVFLILKIGIPNWLAHLNFMKNFRLSQKTDNAEKDEHGYYIASLEAAIEHIRSGAIMGSSYPESMREVAAKNDSPECEIRHHKSEDTCGAIKSFFDLLKQGDLQKVQSILMKTNSAMPDIKEKLCHPLCSCDQCEQERKQFQNEFYPTLNSRDDKGCTALHVAAEHGQDKILEFLINLKADVNATDFRGRMPIHHACQRGHQNASLMLLHHGATVNVVDNDGNTPLHLCALNGHEDCVKALLYFDEYMNGCSIQLNATNDNGDTPLHFAARWGYDDIVKILLEFGACVESKNKRSQTPLDCSHNTNVLRLLEKAFDDIQMGQNNGFIHIQSKSPPSIATVNKIQETKKQREMLISNTTVVKQVQKTSAKSIEKLNKLMKAIAEGDINLACFYLGLDVEEYLNDTQFSDDCSTPLCHPLCQCKKCIHLQKSPRHVQSPVTDDDISVNSVTSDGKTPLHEASLHGHRPLVNILLENGANPNTRTKHQRFSPLHIACQHNHLEVAQLLISHEASVNLTDALGRTPLHLSCMNGNFAMTRLLTKNGAALNTTSHDGNTPLHAAARQNIFPLVDHLVHEGADISIANKEGLMPSDLAIDGSVKRLLLQPLKRVNLAEQSP